MTDELLHILARVLLRVCAPSRACLILGWTAALLPKRETRSDVRHAALRVRRTGGTCLSRAMTVAARSIDAEVIIGVMPAGPAPFFAHAWLEIARQPIDASDVMGHEIARVRCGRARRMSLWTP